MSRFKMSSRLKSLVVYALFVAVVLGVFAASRPARHRVVQDNLVVDSSISKSSALWGRIPNRAQRKAKNYWHTTRCTGPIGLRYRPLPGDTIARAHWKYVVGVPAVYLDCYVTFDVSPRLPFALYCAAMFHEYGHFHGFHEAGAPDGHSLRRRNVMYPVLTRLNVPKTCL